MNRFVNIPSKTRVLTLALLVCALLVAFSGSAARAQLVAPTLNLPGQWHHNHSSQLSPSGRAGVQVAGGERRAPVQNPVQPGCGLC
jgi:hypothetical protein